MPEEWEIPTKVNWFLIMVSWEAGADAEAQESFKEVFDYLKIFKSQDAKDREYRDEELNKIKKNNPANPLLEIVPDSLRGLNLIGRRKFVIILQTKSNRVLLELSKRIAWGRHISVEIFPASYVFEVHEVMFPEYTLLK